MLGVLYLLKSLYVLDLLYLLDVLYMLGVFYLLNLLYFKRISSILIPKSSNLHRYVKKVRRLYDTRYKCNHKHDPKIFYLI